MPRKYTCMQERIIANGVVSEDSFYNGTPCWIWTGATTTNRSGKRYGKINIRIKRGPNKGKIKSAKAHRESIKAFTGRVLTTKSVARHLCNLTLCCNWEHLIGGSQRKNVRQCVVEGRHGNMYLAPVRELEQLAA